jgi:dipeptidase D
MNMRLFIGHILVYDDSNRRGRDRYMGSLYGLEPQGVFGYFEDVCRIPHGSGNTDQISLYLVDFAKRHGLFYRQDSLGNVIIKKKASVDYEEQPLLILQGHMDMVAVKRPGMVKDLTKEGIEPILVGDRVRGEGTSLGGDDGIALAYGLAVLSDDTLAHPALEVVFTVGEEVGMDGARGIDLSGIRGRRLVNLDSEEEGIFCVGCAGGARLDAHIPVKFEGIEGQILAIRVDGLIGGHSGIEIHKGRGNANILLGRLLGSLAERFDIGICTFHGGLADNAIPREAAGEIVVSEQHCQEIRQYAAQVQEQWREEFGDADPNVIIEITEITCDILTRQEKNRIYSENDGNTGQTIALDTFPTDGASTEYMLQQNDESHIPCIRGVEAKRLCAYLAALPDGVRKMSGQVAGMVETSSNLGVLHLDKEGLHARFSVRSDKEGGKAALIQAISALTYLAGGNITVSGDYPGWTYLAHSPLREKMIKVYREMYHTDPSIETIHAGLECGIFSRKLEGLDCVSIGPNMGKVHTTEEYLEIDSVKRVWEYLIKLLATKD